MSRSRSAAFAAVMALALPARAEPVTVELLLGLEDIGQVRLDPDSRWFLAERLRAPDDLPRHDLNASAYADLYVGDPERAGAVRLLPMEPDTGVTLGDADPDGSRVAVLKLREDRLTLGILDMSTRDVRWTRIAPLPATWGRAMEWTADGRLLVLGTSDGALPMRFAPAAVTADRLIGRWREAAAGRASVVVNETAAVRSGERKPPEAILWSIDAATGAATALARGPFIDLELSYDGRTAAVTLDAAVEGPPAGAVDEARRRRSLLLVDVADGRSIRPPEADDIAATLLNWSPVTGELLVFSRRDGAFLRVGADGRTRRVMLADGVAPHLPLADGIGYQPQGGWLGADPVVLAREPATRQPRWWRIGSGGPTMLDLGPAPAGRLSALTPEAIAIETGGRVWVARGDGRIADAGRRVGPSTPGGVRVLSGPMKADKAWIDGGDGRVCDALADAPRCIPAATEGLAAMSERGGAVLRIVTGDTGVRRLLATTSTASRPVELLTVNPELARVRYASPIRISGATASGWLYLPEGRGPFPVIAIPYPDRVFASPPSEMRPGARSVMRTGQLLVSAGYAVLYPDLPHRDDPAEGLAGRILAVIDAAAAEHPAVDRTRIGLWGWSFGAWASVMSASQTERIGAVVALNGGYDPLSALGLISLAGRVEGEMEFFATDGARWLETGQAGLNRPYWDDPERYERNSAVVQAPLIRAPVLLMTGDRDLGIGQSELLFSALNRLNRPAALLTFFGEDHGFVGPGNLRQMYAQTIGWFDRYLKGRDASTVYAIANGDTTPRSGPD